MSDIPFPPHSIEGFPTKLLRSGRPLFRLHQADYEPEWYSVDGTGRFDPPANADFGTCYTSVSALGAFIEVLGRSVPVLQEDVDRRAMAVLSTPVSLRLADLTDPVVLGLFGLTAEAGAGGLASYPATQAWAEAFHLAGFDGVIYRARHDPAGDLISVAVFGKAGVAGQLHLQHDGPIPPFVVDEAYGQFAVTVLPATHL